MRKRILVLAIVACAIALSFVLASAADYRMTKAPEKWAGGNTVFEVFQLTDEYFPDMVIVENQSGSDQYIKPVFYHAFAAGTADTAYSEDEARPIGTTDDFKLVDGQAYSFPGWVRFLVWPAGVNTDTLTVSTYRRY